MAGGLCHRATTVPTVRTPVRLLLLAKGWGLELLTAQSAPFLGLLIADHFVFGLTLGVDWRIFILGVRR